MHISAIVFASSHSFQVDPRALHPPCSSLGAVCSRQVDKPWAKTSAYGRCDLQDPTYWWLSRFFRARTCWRPGGREFSGKLHSRSAYRRRMLDGRAQPVCVLFGPIQVAKPVPMTQRSEQRQQQLAVASFLSLLLDCLGPPSREARGEPMAKKSYIVLVMWPTFQDADSPSVVRAASYRWHNPGEETSSNVGLVPTRHIVS
jgi:hypothetical protein